MTYVLIAHPPVSFDDYQAVNDHIGDKPIDGLLARYAGMSAEGLVVITVWESKAHADRFTAETLVPAIHAIHGDAAADRNRARFEEFDAVDVHVAERV